MEAKTGNRTDLILKDMEILLSSNKLYLSPNLYFLFLSPTYGNCYSELLQIITSWHWNSCAGYHTHVKAPSDMLDCAGCS